LTLDVDKANAARYYWPIPGRPGSSIRRAMHSFFNRWLGLQLPRGCVVPDGRHSHTPPLLDHSFPSLAGGKPIRLAQFAGQVILAVNTASECGFTSQYDGLQKLYAELKDRVFVIIGFPSNDFGGQEPGTDKEIAGFCQLNYGVTFPMAAKSAVTGASANPFFRQLVEASGTRPKWNFYKYLINRDATEVLSFSSLTKPDSKSLRKKIELFLA
jgi:glutathione peroxidase